MYLPFPDTTLFSIKSVRMQSVIMDVLWISAVSVHIRWKQRNQIVLINFRKQMRRNKRQRIFVIHLRVVQLVSRTVCFRWRWDQYWNIIIWVHIRCRTIINNFHYIFIETYLENSYIPSCINLTESSLNFIFVVMNFNSML